MNGNISEYYLELDYLDVSDMFNETSVSEEESHSIRVVSMVLYSITCVLGIPGNAFVIWIAGVKMKRTVNTTWFVNLAVADLLCCVSIPFSMAEVLRSHRWPYGAALCKLLPSVVLLNMFASVFTLTLISLDRFALVIRPVWAQNHRSLSLASLLCLVAWVLAVLLSLPSMVHRETLYDHVNNRTLCSYVGPPGAVRATYVTRFAVGFLVPLLVIALCYLLIARRVSSGRFKSQRALRIIVGVVVAFFVCWLPYHTLGLVMEYADVGRALDPLAISLAYVNSCLNPLLYVFMGQDFKERIRLSLRRVFENAFSEDVTRSTLSSRGRATNTSRATNSFEAQV